MLEVDDRLSPKEIREDVPASSRTLFPAGSDGPDRGMQSRPLRPDPGPSVGPVGGHGHREPDPRQTA